MLICSTCFGNQFNENYLISNISIYTCLKCGLLISDIKPTETIESEYDRINDETYHRSISKVRQQQAIEILSFVKQYDSKGHEWFDIGCSFGYLLSEAKRTGYSVFGIEPDEKALEHARKLIGNDFVHQGVMANHTIPNESVDIISMLDVLEHIPAVALSDFACLIHQKLRPGGLWVIKVPSTEGFYFTLSHRLLKFTGSFMSAIIKRLWQSEYQFPHTVYFNQQTLRQYMENHKFKVIAFRYLEDVPNNTVIDRLLMDNTIPKWQAFLISPAFYLINFIEKWRGKSDALLMLARRQ